MSILRRNIPGYIVGEINSLTVGSGVLSCDIVLLASLTQVQEGDTFHLDLSQGSIIQGESEFSVEL